MTAPAAAAPAAAAPVAAAKPPDLSQIEKHFRSEGYSVQMHGGQKMYCRHEDVMGSRLSGKAVCSTLEHLQATEEQAKAATESIQNSSHTGCLKPCT